MIFNRDKNREVRDQNPGMAFIEVSKQVASIWRDLSDNEK